MLNLLRFVRLPVFLGLFIGLVIILSNQQWRYTIGDEFRSLFVRPTLTVDSYADAVRMASPAVVNISTRTTVELPRNPLFDDPLFRHFFNKSNIPTERRRMSSALGSGVIIDKKGHILTNYHVVRNAEEIIVSFPDGRNLIAQNIGADRDADLAVLKIPGRDDLPVISLGNTQEARIGDVVLAIGNPLNIGQTVTQGIISATGRYGLGVSVYENFIQTDAAINPGNSGGALINTQGELVGINTAILNQNNDGSSVTGIGFAIPSDIAVAIMGDIINAGTAIRGWLGIEAQGLTPELIKFYNLETANGVLITGTYPNGPAEKAGLQIGDILTHINQESVDSGRRGMNLIAQVRPEQEVTLTISRSGISFDLTAIAGKRPE